MTTFRYARRGNLQSIVAPSGVAWRYEFDDTHESAGSSRRAGSRPPSRERLGRVEKFTRGPWPGASIATIPRPVRDRPFRLGPVATIQNSTPTGGAATERPPEKCEHAYDQNGLHSTIKSADYKIESNTTTTARSRGVVDPLGWIAIPRDAQEPCGRRVEQPEKPPTPTTPGARWSASIFPAAPPQDREGRAGRPAELTLGTAGDENLLRRGGSNPRARNEPARRQSRFQRALHYDAAGILRP